MKSLRSLTIAIMLLSISCFTQAQSWKTVTGNGDVVTKERKTDSFTGLKVSSGIDVYLKQGNEVTVTVVNISVSSAGDADINVSERINARASSAGDINYRGDPKYIDAHASSAGGIHKR